MIPAMGYGIYAMLCCTIGMALGWIGGRYYERAITPKSERWSYSEKRD
jgi:hypothetical protein